MPSNHVQFHRRFVDSVATVVAASLSTLVVGALVAIFAYLVIKGAGSVNLAFLTHTPKPVGEIGGGMANAIVGSAIILAIGSAIGIPFGIGAGIYLAEYGRNRLGSLVRFTADVLNGVPSIVIGLVAFSLVVMREGHFSAFSAGVALAIMMVPMVARTTEEMLLLVPQAVREAAFGLGVPQWRTTISITLATARAGILTGIMLAFARIAGETAPLMFTALGNQFWSFSANQPIAAVPLQIYTYALSPYDDWHRQAWAGALVLVALIVGTISVVRYLFGRSILREVS